MKLSKESEYGLAGLAYLTRQRPGTILMLRDVARARGLPQRFLAKIFRKLTRVGVLTSYRGRQRGYALARPPAAITVREILEGIEGTDVFTRCVFWSNRCSDDHPCLLHDMWKSVRPELMAMMERITLDDVARRRLTGRSWGADLAQLAAGARRGGGLRTRRRAR